MDQNWQRIANLVFELDKKVVSKNDNPTLLRIHGKMKQVVADAGIWLYDPSGEKYSETRTDIEANIAGSSTKNLVIKEVIKPVLYKEDGGKKILLQKGIVIVSEH